MYFAGFGCITSIGVNKEMTLSSINAGISGYRETNYLTSDNQPGIMSDINDDFFMSFSTQNETMESYTAQMDRSSKMILYALNDLESDVRIPFRIPLIWQQEETESKKLPISLDFLRDQLTLYEAPIDLSKIDKVAMGRASGLAALDRAYQYLHQAGHDYVLIGGAECPHNNNWLDSLDKRKRLKKVGSKDGFSPGEASTFLLLSRERENATTEQGNVIRILSPGTSQSPAHWYNAEKNTGESLCDAMKVAIGNLYRSLKSEKKIQKIYSSMNGESFWAKEYGVAAIRLQHLLEDDYILEHPFEYTGDLGSVSSTFLLGLACTNLLSENNMNNSLVYCSADNEWRTAVCIEKTLLSSQ